MTPRQALDRSFLIGLLGHEADAARDPAIIGDGLDRRLGGPATGSGLPSGERHDQVARVDVPQVGEQELPRRLEKTPAVPVHVAIERLRPFARCPHPTRRRHPPTHSTPEQITASNTLSSSGNDVG